MGRKTYEELETEAKVISSQISELESQWESENEPERLAKMESKIDRLEARREKVLDRMDALTDKEALPENEDKEVEEGADFLCEDCGGDLEKHKDGLYECVNCGELYEEG